METTLISKPVFRWFLLNYTDFVHKISHTKPSKYDSTSGTKISICLKKNWGDVAVDRNKHLLYDLRWPWKYRQKMNLERNYTRGPSFKSIHKFILIWPRMTQIWLWMTPWMTFKKNPTGNCEHIIIPTKFHNHTTVNTH